MNLGYAGYWQCLALPLSMLLGLGCQNFDAMGRRSSLHETQLHYTQMLRWGEFNRASQHVDPEAREEYQRNAPALEGMRVTEFDIGDIQFDEENLTANVVVTYRAYSLTTLVETSFREEQEWRRTDGTNDWLVRPKIEGLVNGDLSAGH